MLYVGRRRQSAGKGGWSVPLVKGDGSKTAREEATWGLLEQSGIPIPPFRFEQFQADRCVDGARRIDFAVHLMDEEAACAFLGSWPMLAEDQEEGHSELQWLPLLKRDNWEILQNPSCSWTGRVQHLQ